MSSRAPTSEQFETFMQTPCSCPVEQHETAAALLARYDRRVLLVEAHDVVGGCAHSFDRGGYTCDSGPSLWAGCAQPSTSPLRQVFDAIGRDVDWVQYDGWGLHDLKADKRWRMTVGPDAFADVMQELGGPEGERAWRDLLKGSEPVVDAAMACCETVP